ncbi:MAG: hypothetical protein LBU32_25415 [Clostridiales bacterium]|jgi:hypothetical protein|nr:hypothetical protein [Clostridiales bacterium]
MKKKALSLILVVIMIVACIAPIRRSVYAENSTGKFLATIGAPDPNAKLIHNAQELSDISNDLSASYVLANDIDLSEYNEGKWDPIHGFDSIDYLGSLDSFTGTLDGQGFIITNLTYKGFGDYAGLFRHIGDSATIKNIGLENISISINDRYDSTPAYYAGGICGNIFVSNGGTVTISNCYTEGIITVINNHGSSYAGGIVGIVGGSNGNVIISNCYNSASVNPYASVTGGGAWWYSDAGGIVGLTNFIDSTSTIAITSCYNEGDIFASSGARSDSTAGGIIGNVHVLRVNGSAIKISNCYNTGDISCQGRENDHAGGINGRNDLSIGSTLTIDKCYNTGNINSTSQYSCSGGISGSGYTAASQYTDIRNCVVLSNTFSASFPRSILLIGAGNKTNNLALSNISGNGTNDANALISISEAKNQSTYEALGWDFKNVWEMVGNYDYPQLRGGTESNNGKEQPDSIEITQDPLTINVGETIPVVATLKIGDTAPIEIQEGITWSSDDSNIASVVVNSESGICSATITGKTAGKVIIKATKGSLLAELEVTVLDDLSTHLEPFLYTEFTGPSYITTTKNFTGYDDKIINLTIRIRNVGKYQFADSKGNVRLLTEEEKQLILARNVQVFIDFPTDVNPDLSSVAHEDEITIVDTDVNRISTQINAGDLSVNDEISLYKKCIASPKTDTGSYEFIVRIFIDGKIHNTSTLTIRYSKLASSIKTFSVQKDGWSFVNNYEGFGYENDYVIPNERYAQVFGSEYVNLANNSGPQQYESMINSTWIGNCIGMVSTAFLFFSGKLDLAEYLNPIDGFDNVNDYYTEIKWVIPTILDPDWEYFQKFSFASSNKLSNITELIEQYSILGNKSLNATNSSYMSTIDNLNGEYFGQQSDTRDDENRTVIVDKHHNGNGNYISNILDRIIASEVPFGIDLKFADEEGNQKGHFIMSRTDIRPEKQSNGWWRVYVYDPNHPYVSPELLEGNKSRYYSYNNILNDGKDTYIELNREENKFRYGSLGAATDHERLRHVIERNTGYELTIKEPHYILLVDLNKLQTEIRGNEPHKWMPEDVIEINTASLSSFDLFLSDGRLGAITRNGDTATLESEVSYSSYDGYLFNNDKTTGGKLVLPKDRFSINYLEGSDISLLGYDNLISIRADKPITLNVDLTDNRLNLSTDNKSNIEIKASNVFSSEKYSSVILSGSIEPDSAITFSLADTDSFSAKVDYGNCDINILTDTEKTSKERFIMKLDSNEPISFNVGDNFEEIITPTPGGSGSYPTQQTTLTTDIASKTINDALIANVSPTINLTNSYNSVYLSGKDLLACQEKAKEISIKKNLISLFLTPNLVSEFKLSDSSYASVEINQKQFTIRSFLPSTLQEIDSSNSELLRYIYNTSLSANGKSVLKTLFPLKVIFDISNFKLSAEQKAKLTGVNFDSDFTAYKQLGGELSPDGNTFTFYTYETGNLGIIISNSLTKIHFIIDNFDYYKNGTKITNDVSPYISSENRTMLPLRVIAETLGAEVDWTEATKTVTVTKASKTLTLVINQTLPNSLGTAVIGNGRTFVPIRYIAEQLGANVVWNEDSRTVDIYQ